MASQNARRVAREVLEKIGKGQKVSVSKIARGAGYSKATAKNPQQITRTKTFKAEVDPVIKAMTQERNRILKALAKKQHQKEKYRDLMDGLDKLTKNIQLLSGKETERAGITINTIKYGGDPPA